MPDKALKIGIDLDDTITYCTEFFSLMTSAMKDLAEIHIITNREQRPGCKADVEKELDELSIFYDYIEVTAKKAEHILDKAITVFFDDTDEYFLNLPESVRIFKIREPFNFDFEDNVWIYSDKTGRHISTS